MPMVERGDATGEEDCSEGSVQWVLSARDSSAGSMQPQRPLNSFW